MASSWDHVAATPSTWPHESPRASRESTRLARVVRRCRNRVARVNARRTQADAWDGWLDDADAVVFAGTSFSVQVTREALRRCRDRRVPIYNFNVDEPEKTVALANAARLRRATALQTCDESFPQLEKAVRSKLRARGLEKPPSLPPPPPPGFLLDDASESSSEAPSSTDDRIILTHYAVPDGFRAVKDSELGRPPALLGQAAVERGDLYLIICCDDGASRRPHFALTTSTRLGSIREGAGWSFLRV